MVRLCTYEKDGTRAVGIERDGRVSPTGYDDMLALIRDGDAGLEGAAIHAERAEPLTPDRLLAPIPRPGTIFGSGVNYKSHGDEEPGHGNLPSEPRIDFIKTPNAVIGPGAPIVIPKNGVINRPNGYDVDYEVEFGVMMGKTCKGASRANALDYVFGYTVFNDAGSRAVQFGVDRFAGEKNWYQADLGKNFDTFMPMGPVIVTKDEILDPTTAHVRCWVNDELRQDSPLSLQLFGPAILIEWISSIITMQPGDCISTGTPGGIGAFMTPPCYLKPGDVVTVSEETIGRLINPVVIAG